MKTYAIFCKTNKIHGYQITIWKPGLEILLHEVKEKKCGPHHVRWAKLPSKLLFLKDIKRYKKADWRKT